MGFFHILHKLYIYKQEVVVIEIPEWKFKAELARAPYLKESSMKFLPILGQK